jgi:hypothetical protein
MQNSYVYRMTCQPIYLPIYPPGAVWAAANGHVDALVVIGGVVPAKANPLSV